MSAVEHNCNKKISPFKWDRISLQTRIKINREHRETIMEEIS